MRAPARSLAIAANALPTSSGPCAGTSYTPLVSTVNTAANTVTATGVSSFSTFAVLHPDALAGGYLPPAVPGGGSRTTDCISEVAVINPNAGLDNRGLVNKKQPCVDGDSRCDADGAVDGKCTYRVAICFNQTDASLPECAPTDVAAYKLNAPKPISNDPEIAANGQALAAALVALGATQGGTKQNEFTFAPFATAQCTELVEQEVTVKPTGKGRRVIRGRTTTGAGTKDRDTVKLECFAP